MKILNGSWDFYLKAMKKVLGKKNLKIIAATAMTIFSLFAAVAGVFAWFTSHLNESAQGTDFGIYNDDSQITTLSCYAIKYDGVYGASATKLESGEDHHISMSEYDYILRDKNVNTPLFFRIEIIGFNTHKDLKVSIPALGNYHADNQTYIDNKLSNVICCKFSYGLLINGSVVPDTYELSGNTINGGDVKTIYTGMRDRVSNVEGTPFVKTASQKDNEIHLTLAASSLYQSQNISHRQIDGETVDIIVIYLAFDYYVTSSTNLVEDYIESYNGTGLDYETTFEPDIGAITMRDVEA